MSVKIGINGFGRIGRLVYRVLVRNSVTSVDALVVRGLNTNGDVLRNM